MCTHRRSLFSSPGRGRRWCLLTVGVAVFSGPVAAAPLLPALAADERAITVSGLSSGGYMAVQFQVAHSSLVRGAGIIAAGPYGCAQGSIWQALKNCMSPSTSSPLPTTEQTNAKVEALARAGQIDRPEHLRDDKVWLLSGGADLVVERPVMDALAGFYHSRLPATAIHYLKPATAGHAMPSAVDPAANACSTSSPPFLNRCLDPDGGAVLDAAGDLLKHLLPALAPAATAVPPVGTFDQRPFISGKPVDVSLADEGFVYVPAVCNSGGCRIHVAFHGCRQNAEEVGSRFADMAGYNRWAETNRLIVLYPQTVGRNGLAAGSLRWLYNPKACWDWWGYTGGDYLTRNAPQISAVRQMIRQLAAPLGR